MNQDSHTMMTTHHDQYHRHGIGNNDPRCDGCGKRHTHTSVNRVRSTTPTFPAPRHRGIFVSVLTSRAVVSISALLLVKSSLASLPIVNGLGGVSHVGGGGARGAFGDATIAANVRVDLGLSKSRRYLHEDEHEVEEHVNEETLTEDEEAALEAAEAAEHEEFQQSKSEVWGEVIGATLLVNLATLAGVLILLTNNLHGHCVKKGFIRKSTSQGTLVDILILSFAAGALLATAVFLILPESIEMIGGGHDSESTDSEATVAAKFGCSFLGGFLLPLVIAIFFHVDVIDDDANVPPRVGARRHSHPVGTLEVSHAIDAGVTVGDPSFMSFQAHLKDDKDAEEQDRLGPTYHSNQEELTAVKPVLDKKLIISVLLGDAFHNCADGILIAASFVSCDIGLAMSIAGITVVHELAQELGDFILLTKQAGLSTYQALILNFCSGMSVVLGAVIFLLANPTSQATGIMLAIGAGVYVNIAATETIPRLDEISKSRMDRVWILVGCIIGTIPIGLVLLNHGHCEPEESH